jgi:hypothetical protein
MQGPMYGEAIGNLFSWKQLEGSSDAYTSLRLPRNQKSNYLRSQHAVSEGSFPEGKVHLKENDTGEDSLQ